MPPTPVSVSTGSCSSAIVCMTSRSEEVVRMYLLFRISCGTEVYMAHKFNACGIPACMASTEG